MKTDLIEREEWLIRKGGFFYRQNCQGYTTTKAEAGRYTKAKAEKEAAVEPWHMKAVHQDDVSPDSLSARVEFYEQKLAYAADRIAALEAEASEGERRGLELAAQAAEELISKWSAGPRSSWAEGYQAAVDDAASAIRALIPEAPVREGWQPIETAPKDGTNVIVAEPDGNVTIARWLDRDESWWELNNDSTDVWGFALNAVQWRPLPPPPPPSQDREG